MAELIAFLFSFKGRIGRVDFWLRMLTIAAMFSVVIIFDTLLNIRALAIRLGIAAFAGSLVVGLSAMARRLHDRNKSAWYILLFLGVPSALQGFRSGNKEDGLQIMLFSGGFSSFIDVVCLAISIWMVVELGILSGSRASNEYGPPPLPSEPTVV